MLQEPITNAVELLTQLRQEGITLWEENGKLRYRAPQGLLQDNDLQTLKDNKRELLDLLETEAKSVNVVPDPKSRYEPFPLTDIQSAYLLARLSHFEKNIPIFNRLWLQSLQTSFKFCLGQVFLYR